MPDVIAMIPEFNMDDAEAVLPLLRKLRVLLDASR
jgi:hypothetical protein